MLNLDDIRRTDKFIVKWGGANYTGADTNNKQTPGWMLETQEDSLLVRLDEETSLMKDANFIKMAARQHAIDYLFVRPTLQPMLSNGGMLTGDIDNLIETIPKFARRELDAKPYVAYTYTPKQFIWENLFVVWVVHADSVNHKVVGIDVSHSGMDGHFPKPFGFVPRHRSSGSCLTLQLHIPCTRCCITECDIAVFTDFGRLERLHPLSCLAG